MSSRKYLVNGQTEYVRVKVTARDDDGPIDPTIFPVEFAFIPDGGPPVTEDWVVGEWYDDNSGIYYARILIGPNDLDLDSPTDYEVWISVNTGLEHPARRAGDLTIL